MCIRDRYWPTAKSLPPLRWPSWNNSITRGCKNISTVSYTHLDVYKRQVQATVATAADRHRAPYGTSGARFGAVGGAAVVHGGCGHRIFGRDGITGPVSYTHLDVYKRQEHL